jgi:hypothetical protein
MPAGRPTDYTPELVDTICDLIADGQSLRKICTDENMPDRKTVLRWLGKHDEFAAKYARAREAQGDHMDDLILSTAEGCKPETAAADRVKIDAYKWRASKLRPKVYGEKITQEHDMTDKAAAVFGWLPPQS